MAREDDRRQKAEDLVKEGNKQIEEESERIKDDATFFQKIGNASNSLRNYIQNVIKDNLTSQMSENPFTELGEYVGEAASGVIDGVNQIIDPVNLTGEVKAAEESDKNFLEDSTKETDQGVIASLGNIIGVNNPKRLRHVVAGTFNTAVRFGAREMGKDVRDFQHFTILTSLLILNDPRALLGMAQEATEAFGVNNLKRRGLLEAIKRVVVEIHDELLNVNPGWYRLNIYERIRLSRDYCLEADQNLTLVRLKTYQGVWDVNVWDEAVDYLEDASKELKDYSDIGLDLGVLKVFALLKTLKKLTEKLSEVQNELNDHKSNIQGMIDNLLEETKMDNYAALLISKLQGQLRNVIREMEQALKNRVKLRLIAKMAKWAITLETAIALMKATSTVARNYIIDDPDGNVSVFNGIGGDLAEINFYDENASMSSLLYYLNRFHSECTQKMAVDTDMSSITFFKNEIVRIIDEQLDKTSAIVDVLLATPDIAQSIINDGGESLINEGKSVATDLKSLAEEFGFDKLKDSLRLADWKEFFGSDPQTASTEGKMEKDLSDLEKSAETPVEQSTKEKMDIVRDRLQKSRRHKRLNSRTLPESQQKSTKDIKRDINELKEFKQYIETIERSTNRRETRG